MTPVLLENMESVTGARGMEGDVAPDEQLIPDDRATIRPAQWVEIKVRKRLGHLSMSHMRTEKLVRRGVSVVPLKPGEKP